MPLSVARSWREEDWALAQALTLYEAMLCEGCGHPIYESMDIESDGEWSSPEPMRCHACTAIAERAAAYGEARAPRALKFSAERRRADQR